MTRILFACLLVAPLFCLGQGRNSTKFFTHAGTEVQNSDSAFYSVTTNYEVKPFFIASNYLHPLAIRFKSSTINDSGDHFRTYYYSNGKMKVVAKFLWDQANGGVKSFYANGTLQADLEVPERKFRMEGDAPRPAIRIINYWDSLGNQTVKNGVGRCACNLDPFDNLPQVESGEVRDSLKTGTWQGTLSDGAGALSFEERYNAGILVAGRSSYKGENFEYTDLETSAKPKKGMASFYQSLGQAIRYPKEARRLGIEGKVFVEFVILRSGALSDVRVVRRIGGGCDEEAVRAVLSLPEWEPGYQRGRKVKQRYILPVIFKLG